MSKHLDGIGYLNNLAKEINESWFQMICDLVTIEDVSMLDQSTLDTLVNIYIKKASYLPIRPATLSVTPHASIDSDDFLEELSGFSNFKLLSDTLKVALNKRITLIFGTNGSGKSSLCKSFKILANHEQPIRPLHNLRREDSTPTAFFYKFKNDASRQKWTQAIGYGQKHAVIKYFDAEIAVKNIRNPVEPDRIIVLTPFKLHVFELAKKLTNQLRDELERRRQKNIANLSQALEKIRNIFGNFKNYPLAKIDETTLSILSEEISRGEKFSQQETLREKEIAAKNLEKATSEDGLKLLKSEKRDLETFVSSLKMFIDSIGSLWMIEPWIKVKTISAKQAEQEVLAKTLIPKGKTLEDLLKLLRATSSLCDLQAATGHSCPLCKRNLGDPEIELFRKYYDLLSGGLEKELATLKIEMSNAENLITDIKLINRDKWTKNITLQPEILEDINNPAEILIASVSMLTEPREEDKVALEALKVLLIKCTQQIELKATAIEAAIKDYEGLIKQLTSIYPEIESLKYAQIIGENLELLKKTKKIVDIRKHWDGEIPKFTELSRKITTIAKKAHEELISADFETRLNAEYKSLTGKDMASFGVKLVKKGSDGSVAMRPQVGGKIIEHVLSEGEQRVHALALFFAELETCSQSVVVFDDPVSSFDYNYIANYCARLRDFAREHPTRQIIILTHNWDFFVQIQVILNKGNLHNCLTVQVMESCAVASEYSEDVEILKKNISATLSMPNEPTKVQKEELAGRMRRLIEVVINTSIFNKQRYQYKQKTLSISEFHKFTQLVPLLSGEATTLSDLYSKLSIPEHDDPRNSYINTDRATFQSYYDDIIAVEAAAQGRKQSYSTPSTTKIEWSKKLSQTI